MCRAKMIVQYAGVVNVYAQIIEYESNRTNYVIDTPCHDLYSVQCALSACMVCNLNIIAQSVQHFSMIIHYNDVNDCKILIAHRVK
jgi:hypothetical protein